MTKSVNIYKFKKENKFILHPLLSIKNFASLATFPYLIEYNLTLEDLLEKIFYLLQYSKDGNRPSDMKKFHKEFLSDMGMKTMKVLHSDSILLGLFVKDEIIHFCPTINKGTREGFSGVPIEQRVLISIKSTKEDLLKALEIALSRCE